MSELGRFFAEKDTSLGTVFYPKDFLIATVPSNEDAFKAAETIGGAEAIAVSSGDMLKFFDEFRSEAGASGGAMRALSRFIDTEVKFADADIENAKSGHGFVLVRCKTRAEALQAASAIAPFHPVSVQWYVASGVESLM